MKQSTKWAEQDLDCSVSEAFERQVERNADKPAMIGPARPVTYRELDELANRYAAALLAREWPDPGSEPAPLALLLPHDHHVLAGTLAALKCGMAVVTLSAVDPPERLARIRSNTDPALILVDDARLDRARAAGFDDRQIVMAPAAAKVDEIDRAALPAGRAEALAFLICTSGSTGWPKIVMQTHRNMLHNVLRYTNGLGIQPDDRLAWLAAPSGGQGLASVWTALLNGATLCPFPVAERGVTGLANWLEEHDVTVFDTIPSVLRNFARTLRDRRIGGALRLVRLASEAALASDFEAFGRHFPTECRLASVLASSEAGIMAQAILDRDYEPGQDRLPVGLPADGVEISLHDDDRPVADGETGEIVVTGRYLSPGYWRDQAMTAQRFETVDGVRRFHTGDLACRGPDGALTVFGRADSQVKVRGHRLQLEEIEAAIVAHQDVSAAAVIAGTRASGDAVLTAYVAGAQERRPAAPELRRSLEAVLPAPAIPTRFVILDSLPLNAHGKLDRDRLADLDGGETHDGGVDAARAGTEELLLGLWAEAFERAVAPGDAFLDLGGDSLIAAVIAASVHDAFGRELELSLFLENPTLAEMARLLERDQNDPTGAAPPAIRRLGRAGPLSHSQLRIWRSSATAHGSAQTVAVPLRISGPLEPELLRRSIEWIIERHEILRTSYLEYHGTPMAVVREPERIEMPVHDLREETDPEARAGEMMESEVASPFDLERGPLLRLRLLRLADEEYRLLRVSHHIVHDAVSWRVFFDELAAIYSSLATGRSVPLAEPPQLQFLDYAKWELDHLRPSSPSYQADVSWWTERLESLPAPPRLPWARPMPTEERPGSDGIAYWGIPASCTEALDRIGTEAMSTYFMTRLALFSSLLAIETEVDDLLVGTVVSTRKRPELQRMFGPFHNQTAVRLRFSGTLTYRQWLAEVRAEVLEVGRHVDIDWHRLLDELAGRGVERPPIRVLFLSDWSGGPIRFAGLELEALPRHFGEGGMSVVAVDHDHEDARCRIKFNPRIHDPARVREFAAMLTELSAAVATEPDRPLGELYKAISHRGPTGPSRSHQDPSSWDQIYSGPPPAWDIGHPQPAIEELERAGLLTGKVLDVGCGTGEDTILAAEHGADALGIDLSPEAIELARAKAQQRGSQARFAVASALELRKLGETFDVAIDSGLFHVFSGAEQRLYAASLAEVVRDGGMLYLTCICDQQDGDWGPRRVSRKEIEAAFATGWVIEELRTVTREVSRPEVHTWSAKAWMATIRRTI